MITTTTHPLIITPLLTSPPPSTPPLIRRTAEPSHCGHAVDGERPGVPEDAQAAVQPRRHRDRDRGALRRHRGLHRASHAPSRSLLRLSAQRTTVLRPQVTKPALSTLNNPSLPSLPHHLTPHHSITLPSYDLVPSLRSGVQFTYFTAIDLCSLWPINGPAMRGGTMVTLYGTFLNNHMDLR